MPRSKVPSVFPRSMRASRIKTGMPPNKQAVQEYARRVDSLSQDVPIPPTLGLRLENYVLKKDDECPPVIVAMRKLAKLQQSTWKQWHEEYFCVTIYVRKWRKLEMYRAAHRCFFVETNLLHDFVRLSLVYNTRDLAMAAYRNDMISWPFIQGINDELKVPSVS